jgi:hypothetical protein
MSTKRVGDMETVNVEPDWMVLFLAAETQLKAQTFKGQAYVLEMFQFGMRSYEAIAEGNGKGNGKEEGNWKGKRSGKLA